MPTDAVVDRDDPAYRGQAIYTGFTLKFADLIGFRFTVPVIWRSSLGRMVNLYDENVSDRHLDIGVGTGIMLDRAQFPNPEPEITLMDLNPACLRAANRRIQRYEPRTHQANVLKPWGLADGAFDSVAMMNVLHCVPGNMKDKGAALDHAARALSPGGTLFGSTILAHGVDQTWLSKRALKSLNRRGALGNAEDSLLGLSESLSSRFPSPRIEVDGAIAFFAAKKSS